MGKAVAKKSAKPIKNKIKAEPAGDRVEHWKKEIRDTWQCAVESIIATGEQLIEAKEDLKGRKGAWGKLCDGLPFGDRTAQRLIAIAADHRIADPTRGSLLPPSWRTLYELTKLDDKSFKQALAKGKINPDMERSDAEKLLEAAKPKIDRDADEAEVIDEEPDGEMGDDDGEEYVEEEANDNKPAPKSRRDEPGPVEPRLSKHDKKIAYVADSIEVLATRLGEFEEMLDASEEVRDSMKSKMSRDMLKRAQEISLIIDRLTKKYLKN
jgi:hypothetical protein